VVAEAHPVDAPLALLQKCQERYSKIRDYSTTIVRQELVGKTLLSEQTIEAKFRCEPFSVYYKWLDPDAGKELIFCAGQNDDKIVTHTTGFAKALMGPSKADPDSSTAMKGTRQSVREAGIGKLIERLITRLEFERQFDRTKIETKHMKINSRPCYMIAAIHPDADDGKFMYHTMKIYIDKAEMLPVRVEVYGYPEKPGTEPGGLIEMYTFLELKINPGLSDFDFSTRNPEYSFSRF
jgi:outer membrane lipoprotein-sorting protein